MSNRIHAFDGLRAAAMIWGIFFHAALSFMDRELSFWIAQDLYRSEGVDLAVWISHRLRMPLFFVIAGFFAHMLYQRWGVKTFVIHRFKRIFIPFVLAGVSITPINAWLWYRAGRLEEVESFFSLAFVKQWMLGHLWFLEFLLLFYLLMILSFPWVRLKLSTKLFIQWWSPFVLALITLPLIYFMESWVRVDQPIYRHIPPLTFCYYAVFFFYGKVLYTERNQLAAFVEYWKRYIPFLVVFIATIIFLLPFETRELHPHYEKLKFLWFLTSSLFTWLGVFLLLGVGQILFQRDSTVTRYISDASYWFYLCHVPLVAWAQYELATKAIHPGLKYVGILFFTFTILLITYQFFVRHTWVGNLLHGRK